MVSVVLHPLNAFMSLCPLVPHLRQVVTQRESKCQLRGGPVEDFLKSKSNFCLIFGPVLGNLMLIAWLRSFLRFGVIIISYGR